MALCRDVAVGSKGRLKGKRNLTHGWFNRLRSNALFLKDQAQ